MAFMELLWKVVICGPVTEPVHFDWVKASVGRPTERILLTARFVIGLASFLTQFTFVSSGGYSKVAQSEWLKQQTLTILRVLEARSVKSRCWWGWFLLRAVRENLFHASLLASDSLHCFWCKDGHLSPWVFTLSSLNVCLSLCSNFPFL